MLARSVKRKPMWIAHLVSILGKKSVGLEKGTHYLSVIVAIPMFQEEADDNDESDEIGVVYFERF